MQALLISTVSVAIAEIGDKTQLLALLLAARFRQPVPIASGILVATLCNHALAGWLGVLLADTVPDWLLRWLLVAAFLAVAAWALVPDRLDAAPQDRGSHGVFLTTLIAFFLVEMGDKTQVATVVLAARFDSLWQVVAGTTLGMLVANLPLIWLGNHFADRLPLRAARWASAALFAAMAIWIAGSGFGGI